MRLTEWGRGSGRAGGWQAGANRGCAAARPPPAPGPRLQRGTARVGEGRQPGGAPCLAGGETSAGQEVDGTGTAAGSMQPRQARKRGLLLHCQRRASKRPQPPAVCGVVRARRARTRPATHARGLPRTHCACLACGLHCRLQRGTGGGRGQAGGNGGQAQQRRLPRNSHRRAEVHICRGRGRHQQQAVGCCPGCRSLPCLGWLGWP